MADAMLAAFADASGLVAAARGAADRGLQPVDAFTPVPVEALDKMLGTRTRLPWIMLAAGLAAAAVIYAMQHWSATRGYPFLVGGRALASWPAFIIASVEFAILAAGVAGFLALLSGAGLPRLNHPLFDSLAFERASQDQFMLALALDEYDPQAARTYLFEAGAVWVEEVSL